MSRPRKIFIIVLVLCVAALLAQIIYGVISRNGILNNTARNYGVIESVDDASKGRCSVNYLLYVKGTVYHNSDMYNGFSERLKKALINKTLPVIYDSTHPRFSKILIFKSDFDGYNLPYPDSLQWAEEMR